MSRAKSGSARQKTGFRDIFDKQARRKHGTNVRVDGQKPNRRRPYWTSRQRTAKFIIHQGAKRRFGDCARKVTELTPGDLFRVASADLGGPMYRAYVGRLAWQ